MCCSRKFKEGAQSQKGSAGLRKQFWIRIQLYRFFLYFLSIIVLLHYSSLTLITPPPFKLYISVNGWVIWVTFHVFEEHYFKALSSFIQYRNMCPSLMVFHNLLEEMHWGDPIELRNQKIIYKRKHLCIH